MRAKRLGPALRETLILAPILAPMLMIGGVLLVIWLAGADERSAEHAATQESERTLDKLRRIPGVYDAHPDPTAWDSLRENRYSVEFEDDLDAAELTTALDAVEATTDEDPYAPSTPLVGLTMNDVGFQTSTPSALVVGLASAPLVMGEADLSSSEIFFASHADFLARTRKALAGLVRHRAVTPDHLRFEVRLETDLSAAASIDLHSMTAEQGMEHVRTLERALGPGRTFVSADFRGEDELDLTIELTDSHDTTRTRDRLRTAFGDDARLSFQ